MKIKIPDINMLCRKNLLLNSDFKSGIINQRGAQSYSANSKWELSIDGWIYQGGIQVYPQSGSVRLYRPSSQEGNGYFKQIVTGLKNGKYLVHINVVSSSGTIVTDITGASQESLIKGEHNIIANVTDGTFKLQINVNSKAGEVVIDEMKLEKGSHFTGMPAWDYGEQMLLCRRKFRTMVGRVYRYAQKADKFNGVQFPLVNEYEMDGTPIITIQDTYKANCTIVKENQFGYIYAQITPTAIGNYEAQFKVTINTYEN